MTAAASQELLALGRRLTAERRFADAGVIFEHLAAADPRDLETQRAAIAALEGQGRTLEALARLQATRGLFGDVDALLADIRTLSGPAIAKYNAHLAAGRFDQAEPYVAAMASLAPHSEAMLGAALACNQALGRTAEVARYARALLVVEPGHAAAQQALDGLAGGAGDEIAQKVAAALSPDSGQHPLLRLRDMHDVASLILCGPLDAEREGQVEALRAAARALAVEVEPGSEWAGWETHYRLLLEAMDLDAVRDATPPSPAEPFAEVADSQGAPLAEADLRGIAERLEAKCVFFAAADEGYVDLYARWYALSVLKHADVSAMVVIHVIGGAGRLAEIAAKVGVADPRLVFTADAFDAAAVTTRAYDSPPKGLAAKPVAHFQSVRFQRLGGLIETLGRPVFVSDIDLLLQRGVADLLERSADDDLVLNENDLNTNAASRFTANLLLVRPTANAQVFLAVLRRYLDQALAGAEVTRWIDQAGLIIAKHHLERHGQAPRIGRFDTASDINNVMYPTYQEHPFRFLSLYHGFDTSSLEGRGLDAA